jgi:hypothetical protein
MFSPLNKHIFLSLFCASLWGLFGYFFVAPALVIVAVVLLSFSYGVDNQHPRGAYDPVIDPVFVGLACFLLAVFVLGLKTFVSRRAR